MVLEILEWPIIFLIKIPSLEFFTKLLPDINNDTGRAKMEIEDSLTQRTYQNNI